jgi:hypothetical protein
VELAKHYEHRVKDFGKAEEHALTALELANGNDFPAYEREHWEGELNHRLGRLEKKMGKV